MSDYVRPTLPRQVFYDNAGTVIDYGNRWRLGAPPKDSYSVTSNKERFAPLHVVADALIEYLATNYGVEVTEDVAFARDLLQEPYDVSRAVRIVPLNADQAALTFVFTSFPGVVIHAGLLHDFTFPPCGCDACDDSVESAADDLEEIVLSVAAGGFSEGIDPDAVLPVSRTISSADGSSRRSGATAADNFPVPRLQMATERLKELPNGWRPWSPRA